jgi:hypothetical protein
MVYDEVSQHKRRPTMTSTSVELQGTLREDGTLELDNRPELPPGRVKIVLQPVTASKSESKDIIEVLKEIHAGQARRGYIPRSLEEINAEIAESRDEGERERLYEQVQEECRRERERQGQSSLEHE